MKCLITPSTHGLIPVILSGLVIQAFRVLIEWPNLLWNTAGHERI